LNPREEKEAKRLLSVGGSRYQLWRLGASALQKSFCFFFFRKRRVLFFSEEKNQKTFTRLEARAPRLGVTVT
jgi:hypothetical protein